MASSSTVQPIATRPTTPPPPQHRDPKTHRTPERAGNDFPSGTWDRGRWWCQCNPRREAVLAEVKHSENGNEGKFFWKCNTRPYCKFFLWYDKAKALEKECPGAPDAPDKPAQPKTPILRQRSLTEFGVLFHSRKKQTEPVQAPGTADLSPVTLGRPTPTQRGHNPPSDSDTMARATRQPAAQDPTVPASLKRKQKSMDEEAAELVADLDSEEERELTGVAHSSQDPFITPSTIRRSSVDISHGLPTPDTTARVLFRDVSPTKKQKTVSFDESRSTIPFASQSSSSGSQPGTHLASPAKLSPSSSPKDEDHDVTPEVMNLLRNQNVDEAVLASIRDVLRAAALQSRGLSRGRQLAREAVKEKDTEIAHLRERITTLEDKVREQNANRSKMRASLQKLYNEN
ncbi:hypothetical protein B0I35DRAFT_404098 [Stachybotrys elegans]|uniref:GRF-type domain-containing protein n=1 Tax=Stachybotrys elegans TaxID=80388 RepID=A0A8K0T7W0_9HYPO|nr:hypothetical protein B0I35DRAFT_404098 [Stachybotrys elegans]